MTEKQSNHLINESSPYLLQHAYNPVDWYPWGFLSLGKARLENKLIVVSIGYAACHWCHVMEHESFEDEEVAALMNAKFVSVKVDREERPDIDQVYMTAAYATTGRGGWPLNVIALPDQRPVFAGTYFRKSDWMYILNYYADLFAKHPAELTSQAAEISAGMSRHFRLPRPVGDLRPEKHLAAQLFKTMARDFDPEHGGTIGAPKFPMPVSLRFLLDYGVLLNDPQAIDHLELTLDNMGMGGIYDHLGGGFSRYSVDDEWHVPHFEKMLYDNAQLIGLYSSAFQQKKYRHWKEIVEETISFTENELRSPEGLWYASIDADSEGAEGAFYVWKTEEIRRHFGSGADIFLEYFNCTHGGNWEHGLNVLKRSGRDAGDENLRSYLDTTRKTLKSIRDQRERPATDDKILTAWNALMISALVEASRAFHREDWLVSAIRAAETYPKALESGDGKLWRNAKNGILSGPGFLDDHSLLIRAFLDLYQATFHEKWLDHATRLVNRVLSLFTASDGLFFNLSPSDEPTVVMNSAELSDNVIPASNSVMAHNLFVLGHISGKSHLHERAEKMVQAMLPDIRKNPAFHANWASLLLFMADGPTEIKIVSDDPVNIRRNFSNQYFPGVIWSGGANLRGLPAFDGQTRIYVCKNRMCFPAVEIPARAEELLLSRGD